MLQKLVNELTSYLADGQNCRNIFRLAVVLCLFFIFKPDFSNFIQEVPAAEHGIGGGILYEEDISDADNETIMSLASLESLIQEPASLSKSGVLLYDTHLVTPGENISTLAVNLGLNQDTIISVNKITNTRLLQIGKVLKIPNQDGILHSVKRDDTLDSIAQKYNTDPENIITANELFSGDIRYGTDLFIPGAKLDWVSLQEINGDLFIWPINGIITSPYGYRRDPFNGTRRQFHTGLDIRGSTGTPVRAAMSGRVTRAGFDPVMGNYVVINHHSGYRTLYGHMSVIRTRNGAYVGTGERIGDVGSTGLSTGPHLHFTVYKDGVLVNPRMLMK
uniref:Membrane protein n=1 Tax=uncultured bacterium contig00003 TaxID=1181495 RepID=A0A806KG36_9BACT|nr:membrane protein [uncultured bacterium contig00003]